MRQCADCHRDYLKQNLRDERAKLRELDSAKDALQKEEAAIKAQIDELENKEMAIQVQNMEYLKELAEMGEEFL